MTQVRITRTDQTKIVRTYSDAELTALLAKAVEAELQGRWGDKFKATVRYEDETAGSPAYRTGTRATVTVTMGEADVPVPLPASDPSTPC